MEKFEIPLEPKAQMRPRFSSRGKFSVAYKDKKQEANEKTLLFYLDKHRPETPYDKYVFIEIVCIFGRPKSHFRTGKYAGELKPNAPFLHTKKPDIDNLQKMLFDCMNGMYFEDDKQICEVSARKYYGKTGKWIIKISDRPIMEGV